MKGTVKNKMEIKNVKCIHCGAEGYNPSVPKGHVIDTCSKKSCLEKADIVIGFKNGNIMDCSAKNLYRVSPNIYKQPMIDSKGLDESDLGANDLFAIAKFNYFEYNFDELQKAISQPEIKGTPEAFYLESKIFFKKLNNTAKGVKFLRLAAEGGFSPAMAEYGYIISEGLYGTPVRVEEGLDYLYASALHDEPLAGAYLADIYKQGTYHGTSYEDLSDEEWYRLITLGLDTDDPMVHIVLGAFHHHGRGCELDLDKAVKHYRAAASQEYVLAMYFLLIILYDRWLNSSDSDIRDEILQHAEFYLEHASDKANNQYQEVKSIYEDII